MDGATPDWAELGRQVKIRREDLRLRQDELGPSDLTIRKLERGVGRDLRPKTLRQIEHALRWRGGTSERILRGEATPDDLKAYWAPADSESRTYVRTDPRDGHAYGPVLGPDDPAEPPVLPLPPGDAVARLAVELLGALAAQPTRTEPETALAKCLHEFIGERLEGPAR